MNKTSSFAVSFPTGGQPTHAHKNHESKDKKSTTGIADGKTSPSGPLQYPLTTQSR